METAPGTNSSARRAPREVHLRDLWAVVVRHWALVLGITLVVTGGAWYTGRGAVPQYRSQLTLQVSSSKTAFARTDDIDIDPLSLQTDPVLSEALVLTTQELALGVVDRLGLRLMFDDPTIARATVLAGLTVEAAAPLASYTIWQRDPMQGWQLTDAAGTTVSSGIYGEPTTGPGFSFTILPPPEDPRAVTMRVVAREQAAAWVRAGLSYRVREATSAFDVMYAGTDPSLVPLILNQAAAQLRTDGVERLRQNTMRRRAFIEAALDSTQESLRLVLDTIQRFKQSRQVSDLSAEETAVVNTIASLEQERLRYRVQISTLTEAIERTVAGNIEGLNGLAAVGAAQQNAAVAFQIDRLLGLHERRREITAGALGLREDNPQVQAISQQITQGHVALAQAATAELQSLRQRDEVTANKIQELRGQLSGFADTQTRIARINLTATTLTETARWLQGQFQLVQMQEASLGPYVSILDGATPAIAVGSSLKQKLMLGVLVGLLLGVAGAFFLEYLDQTIKTAADVERVLGAPVLGQIPADRAVQAIRNGKHVRLATLTDLPPDSPPLEAYRALRTNVTFVGAERPVQFIVITSPSPGEGKSTTAANLAMALGQSGTRTLLVDGDLRRPQQHRAFRLDAEPGLTDLLLGDASIREVIRPDVHDNLDLLPSGRVPPNPSELLGSDAMSRLVAELRKEYEYIILDTAPVLPVTDAVVASAQADATIVVMRSGETEEVAARRAFELVHRVRARVAGVVLNGVSARYDHNYAYYSYGGYAERKGRTLRDRLLARF